MILRIAIAEAILTVGTMAFVSEDTYNALKSKLTPYFKPTVHMNDGDEDSFLHFA